MIMIGRPLKAGKPRYADGSIQRKAREPEERPEQIMATAINYRIKHHGAKPETARDQRYGYPLGRMRLWALNAKDDGEGLSEKQYAAVLQYVRARHRAMAAQGYPRETPKSIAAEFVSAGMPGGGMSEEETVKLTRAHNGARSAVLGFAGLGVEMLRALDNAARDEGDDSHWGKAIGELRMAANVLVRYYGM